MKTRLSILLIALLFSSAFAFTADDEEYSHARIVRLSFVEGNVTVQRPGSDWANAPVNTPMQEGFQLSTDKNSFAEVQFENGSTARVGELALLKFDQLALTESGNSLNKLVIEHGYGTFHVSADKTELFEVHAGDAEFKADGKSEFRVDADQGQVRVEVLKGSLDVSSPEVSTTLAKDAVLDLTPGAEMAYNLSQGIKRDDWDEWVNERDQQTAEVTPPGGNIQGAPTYGWSDLNQYGTWSYFDGYGYGWVPDAMGPWSPFGFGQWSMYPGFGYTWISYEPWGWLPYHFGGWNYDALFGWAWFPGASWGYSPAVVNWYSGSGWVGWVPRPPMGSGGLGAGRLPPAKPCPGGAGNCIKAINTATLERGGPIQPRQFLKVQPGEGVPVKAPPVQATQLAQLPGTPARLSSAQQAVISGRPVSSGSFLARTSPQGHQWVHRAPESTVSAPPAAVRNSSSNIWGGGSPSSVRGGAAPSARSGFGLAEPSSRGAGAGGGFGRGGSMPSSRGASAGGEFGRSGGSGAGMSHSSGGSVGASSGGSGGGSHGGGGGSSSSGGGGGHH